MTYNPIQEIDNQYVVKDSTSGGYIDRMTYSREQNWTTVWDKELQFVSLTLGEDTLTDVLSQKDTEHYDYHRAVRTKNRHLKLLKDHLGIPYKTSKVATEEKIIMIQKGIYQQLDTLCIQTATIHPKTIDDGLSRIKKHDVYFTRLSPEKEALMKEYNQKLEEFKTYKEDLFKKLFDIK